jgi:DNA mismatch repair protein MutL
MSTIRILPDILSNKIAAGEVVERPASVVKELLENAIDAGAERIVIDVEKGGRSLLKVSDNGSGMHRDDALLSIERYATSKVYTDQDLFSIRTLGFRGEALPSIAAVSRFSLMTRSAESETGTRITMEGGKIMAVTDVGAPRGTTIVVKDLFYNIPARRKFLKTIATEMSHIADTVTHMALGWPSVQFRMLHNGRILKDWPSTGQTKERMLDILGGDLAQGQGLHEIRFQDEWIKISGWLSSPDIWRTSTRSIFVYVNGRFVKNRNMQQALCEGFRGRLIKGRYPVAMVFLEVPFDRLDVNVHPTKNEVRFVDQDRVYTALRSTVIKSLQLAGQPKWRRSEDGAQVFSPNDDYQIRNKEFFHIEKTPAQIPPAKTEDLPCAFNDKKFSVVQSQDIAAEVPSENPFIDSGVPADKVASPRYGFRNDGQQRQHEFWQPAFFSELSVIGQLHDTYILCEAPEALILIDQHAAHERVLYEDLKKRSQKDGGKSQQLLIPETIELGYREADGLLKMLPELDRLGLHVEPFGGRSFVVKAVPELIAGQSIASLIRQMAEAILSSGHSIEADELLEAFLILMACHGAIRAHQSLSMQQMRALLKQLDKCDNSSHCPHGRPLWIQWRTAFLEKAFARVV